MTLPVLSAGWDGRNAESLLWIASYPRSGNTFTRILLANYFQAEIGAESYDINKLHDFIPSDTSAVLWNAAGAALSSSESSEALWKTRPAVLAHYRKSMGDRALPGLKTHTANAQAFGADGFGFRQGDRALYIVRHPLDVLVSFADFNAKEIDAAIDMMISPGLTLRGGKIGGLDVRGSWVEHVTGWIAKPPCPILLVRYEELTTATEQTLLGILGFLKAPIDEARLKHAVAVSRFDKLRAQEKAHTFVERPAGTLSGAFFREGKSLQWLRKLEASQAYRLADYCEEVMVSLGYTHPRDVLFDGRNAFGPLHMRPQNLKPDSIRSL